MLKLLQLHSIILFLAIYTQGSVIASEPLGQIEDPKQATSLRSQTLNVPGGASGKRPGSEPGSAGVSPAPAAAKSGDQTKLSKYEKQLLDFKCDESIRSLTGPLNYALAKNNKELASQIMRMIALAFRLDENDRAAAQAALQATLLNPADEMALFQAAEYLVRDGRWQESESILQALSKSKQFSTTLRAKAFIAHQSGNIFAAIKALEYHLSFKENDERALIRLSYLYLISEDNLSAAAIQRRLAALSKSEYLKQIFLGRALESEKKFEEAGSHYRKAGSHLPDDPLWHAQIGLLLMKAQKVKEADAEFRQCFAARRMQSNAFTNWAVMQAFFGSSENAKKCLEHLSNLRPNASESHFVSGVILEKLGKPSDAAAAFKRAIELNPHNSSPYMHLIALPEFRDNLEKRIDLCRSWCTGCTFSGMAAIEFGNALYQSGKQDEALASFQRAEKLVEGRRLPNDPNFRIAVCKMHASIATIEYMKKNRERALAEAIIFNSSRPESAAGLGMRPPKMDLEKLEGPAKKAAEHALIADALVECRMLSEAESEYRAAMKADPKAEHLHSCLLKVLLDKKDFAGAALEDAAVSQHIVTHIGDLFPAKK